MLVYQDPSVHIDYPPHEQRHREVDASNLQHCHTCVRTGNLSSSCPSHLSHPSLSSHALAKKTNPRVGMGDEGGGSWGKGEPLILMKEPLGCSW